MTLVANYPTKKALKLAKGLHLCYQETSLFGPEYKENGVLYVVGPSAYRRKFYAQVTMEEGKIKHVK